MVSDKRMVDSRLIHPVQDVFDTAVPPTHSGNCGTGTNILTPEVLFAKVLPIKVGEVRALTHLDQLLLGPHALLHLITPHIREANHFRRQLLMIGAEDERFAPVLDPVSKTFRQPMIGPERSNHRRSNHDGFRNVPHLPGGVSSQFFLSLERSDLDSAERSAHYGVVDRVVAIGGFRDNMREHGITRIQRLEESGTAEDLDIKWRNSKADSSEGKTDPVVEVSVRTEQ